MQLSERDVDRAPRVWMNVTTSVNWTRPPVGIVRVEQELFRALSAHLGDRLTACVLADGKFVPYTGKIGSFEVAGTAEVEKEFVWPDASYDFPQTTSLDPLRLKPLARPLRKSGSRTRSSNLEIEFGDILISVGLDWDWENQGLDAVLYDLKTRKHVKVITCCYDLIPVLFPHYCVGDVAAKFKEYFTNLTWASSGMLCISKRSEADYRALATELGMPIIPTKVMLLGNKLPEGNDEISDQVSVICEGRFILFVSTIERRKNHEILYKALRILAEEGRLDPELKLVFVGMPGWGVSDLLKDFELDPLVHENIVQLQQATDAELRRLYECCTFFVYPSFYEGWGLPVAEALAFGKLVIASDRGSIPEVGGDLVEYADPWNARAWADAIANYWDNPSLIESRTARVRSEYHPIHWDETATTVLEFIDAVSAKKVSVLEFVPGYDLSVVKGVHFGSRVLSARKTGTLCHGPYCALPAGPIRIEIQLQSLSPEPISLQFKFVAEKGLRVIQHYTRQVRNGSSTLKFNVKLTHSVEDFELLIDSPEPTDLAIDNVKILLNVPTTEKRERPQKANARLKEAIP